MDIVKICGVAILCAVLGAVLGRAIGGGAVALRLAGLCLVLGASLSLLGDVTAELGAWGVTEQAAEYTALMIKALGIAMLCRICSDICRDCGEATLAGGVESAGKLTLVLLAMPAVSELIEYAKALASRV